MSLKVNLGCGKRNFGEGWVHIDGSDYAHVQYHNITKLPFESGTVDLIYASHTFEYFDREDAPKILSEWKRCLKVGGVLRLAVPDFESMAKLYVTKDIPLKKFLGPIFGKWKMTDSDTIFHRTVYDRVDLEQVLKSVGFEDIRMWDWRKVDHGKFDDYSQAYIPHMDKDNGVLISLNIEATK